MTVKSVHEFDFLCASDPELVLRQFDILVRSEKVDELPEILMAVTGIDSRLNENSATFSDKLDFRHCVWLALRLIFFPQVQARREYTILLDQHDVAHRVNLGTCSKDKGFDQPSRARVEEIVKRLVGWMNFKIGELARGHVELSIPGLLKQ